MVETLLVYLNDAAAIIVVLGLCLMCHEAGHFALAKLFGMQVDEFAFGFGRPLVKWGRGETTYRINILPFGGFVKIAGMEPGSEAVERGFHSRPRWQGALVIAAGSIANVVLAIVLFTVVILWTGVAVPNNHDIFVGKVTRHSPARAAGMERGDQIVAVDGYSHGSVITKVKSESAAAQAGLKSDFVINKVAGQSTPMAGQVYQDLKRTTGSQAKLTVLLPNPDLPDEEKTLHLALPTGFRAKQWSSPQAALADLGLTFSPLDQDSLVTYITNRPHQAVTLTVLRHSQKLDLTMITKVVTERRVKHAPSGMIYTVFGKVGRIGVVLQGKTEPVGVGEAVKLGLASGVDAVKTVLISFHLIADRKVAPQLSGPVAIMALTAQQVQMGWSSVLRWGGLISAILAVMNLLPFPPFDGAKLVQIGVEAIMQRRLEPRLELIINLAGLVVVVFVFIVLTFQDVSNLVRYHTP